MKSSRVLNEGKPLHLHHFSQLLPYPRTITRPTVLFLFSSSSFPTLLDHSIDRDRLLFFPFYKQKQNPLLLTLLPFSAPYVGILIENIFSAFCHNLL